MVPACNSLPRQYLGCTLGKARHVRVGWDEPFYHELTMSRPFVLLAGLIVAVACEGVVEPAIERPTNLTYRLDPSGDPDAPAGVLLLWDPVLSSDLEVYNVYSRISSVATWDLRASTTSTTFHDVGEPDLFYAVSAVREDGEESALSDEVFIDERLRLEAPGFLATTSLDGAIHLAWGDNPFRVGGAGFEQYRVYSTGFSLDDNLCGAFWTLEGTTVSPAFLASALTNGSPRCFAVAAESVEGWESLWSEIRADTPRPDARNVLIYPLAEDPNRSGFRFFQDLNGNGQADPLELGVVGPGNSTEIDFWVFRDPVTDSLLLVPERAGTGVEFYDAVNPVDDLTSIDFAPDISYSPASIDALTGFGYVFEMDGGDGFPRYGALRPTHVGREYMIFDWSFQTDPGNPELQVRGGLPTHPGTGIVVKRR